MRSAKNKNNNYTRLQFDFSKDAVKRLDRIVEKTDSSSRAEAVRNALRVYEYLVEKTKSGYEIQIEKDGEVINLAPMPL